MRFFKITSLLLLLAVLTGCLYPWERDPVTGETPFGKAAGAALDAVPTGNVWAIGGAALAALISGCLGGGAAIKKRKDRQLREIVAGNESVKAMLSGLPDDLATFVMGKINGKGQVTTAELGQLLGQLPSLLPDYFQAMRGPMNSDTKQVVRKARALLNFRGIMADDPPPAAVVVATKEGGAS